MIERIDPEQVEAAARAILSSRRTQVGIEISMPVIYPNGEQVTVIVTTEAGEYVVHDASLGTMYLTGAGVTLNRQMRDRLSELARRYGCDFISGRMMTRCSAEQLSVAIVLVANASRSVGDEAAAHQASRASLFADAVANHVREKAGRRLREREEFTGASGRIYRVSHVLLDNAEANAIAFIEAVASNDAVPRRVSEFLDLKDRFPEIAREAIYDDAGPRIMPENVTLLGRVGNAVPFARMDWRMGQLAA